MELDLRMLLSAAISALLMAGVLHFQARSFPANIPGIHQWSWGSALIGLAMLIACGRDWVSEPVTLLLMAVLTQLGLVLIYMGMSQFQRKRVSSRLIWVPVVVNFLAMVYLLFISPSLWLRVACVSFTNVMLFMPTLWLIVRGRGDEPRWRFSKIYTGLFVFMITLVWALRGGWALIYRPETAPQIPATINQFIVVLFPILVIVFGTGLLLMAFDRLKDELEYLVSHDALTGAYSRRGFLSLAESEISRALRMERPIALLVVDLDYFKQVNDRYGHPAGDTVLRKFVEVARSCLRREDLLGRFGGEEFMVLLPDTSPSAARVVAERIRTAISATRVSIASSVLQVRFTVSVGIACSAGRGSLEELLKVADNAMYLAKSRGRNRVESA